MMSPPCGVSVSGGSSLAVGDLEGPGWLMMRVKECRAVLALAQAPAHDRQSVDASSKPTLKVEVSKPLSPKVSLSDAGGIRVFLGRCLGN